MRKGFGFVGLVFIAMLALGGCRNSSDTFLAYDDNEASGYLSVNNRLTESDLFAEDIAVITEEQNNGGDENLTAGASLLVDIADNKAIYADNVYDKMYPASLTKLLTALVVLKHGEMTDLVTVSHNAANITENNVRVCGYKEGDVISLEALLYSILVYSGNDAAIAAADYVGGSEEAFVKLMNQEAAKIGAVASNFINPHGLHDDNQYTTAYDMYLIFNELLKYDAFRTIIGSSSYTAEYRDKEGNEKQKTLETTNLYLSGDKEPGPGIKAAGGLSGATSKAGSCLVLLCKGGSGKEYISIIMDAADNETLYTQMNYLLSLAAEK